MHANIRELSVQRMCCDTIHHHSQISPSRIPFSSLAAGKKENGGGETILIFTAPHVHLFYNSFLSSYVNSGYGQLSSRVVSFRSISDNWRRCNIGNYCHQFLDLIILEYNVEIRFPLVSAVSILES